MEKNRSNENKCPNCGGRMELRGYTHTQTVGKMKVTDGTAMQQCCTNCGTVDMPLEALLYYEIRAARTVLLDAKDRVDGAVLRCIRKTLGLTQKQLALLLEYDHATLSRMETSEEIVPRAIQLALLILLHEAGNGASPEDLMRIIEGGPKSGRELQVRRTG